MRGYRGARTRVYVCVHKCVMLCLLSANQCCWRKGCWDSSTIPNRKWNGDLEHKHTPVSISQIHNKQAHISDYLKCVSGRAANQPGFRPSNQSSYPSVPKKSLCNQNIKSTVRGSSPLLALYGTMF